MAADVHPTALVDAAAELAGDVSVGAYSVIGAGVVIGAGTRVGSHVVIKGPTSIGRDNRIFQFASVGEEPQDRKFRGERTELIIGERNVIREYCTLHRGTGVALGKTVVGDDNLLMAYVHIAHDCVVGDHVIFANGASLGGHVEVRDHATLGGFSLVHQFCRVGSYAFSGKGSTFSKDLAPYTLASGNPARTHGLNKVGLRRAGFADDKIRALHNAYLDLVRTPGGLRGYLDKHLEVAREHPEVKVLIEFLESSTRGVTA